MIRRSCRLRRGKGGLRPVKCPALSQAHRIERGKGDKYIIHDALSRRTSMTLPNGTVANYTYDAASQLTSLVHDQAGSPIASFNYTYDSVGNRTSLTDLDGVNDYIYDGLNRLVQATHPQPVNPAEDFTYDQVGNRTSSHLAVGQPYDTANRLLEDAKGTERRTSKKL